MNEKICQNYQCKRTFYEEFLTKIRFCDDCIIKILNSKNEAFASLIESGLIGIRQEQVLTIIRKYPNSTDKELSIKSNLPINVINGRRFELAQLGLIKNTGKRECTITHSNVNVWDITKDINVNEVREKRKVISRDTI